LGRRRGPGLIVVHQKSLAAPHLAEKLRIPHVEALGVRHDLGGPLNRASYRLVSLLTRPYSALIRSWRSDHLGLASGADPPLAARTLVVEDGRNRSRAVELSERIGRENGAGKASEKIGTALAERGRWLGREATHGFVTKPIRNREARDTEPQLG
jgi:hypothetical protein